MGYNLCSDFFHFLRESDPIPVPVLVPDFGLNRSIHGYKYVMEKKVYIISLYGFRVYFSTFLVNVKRLSTIPVQDVRHETWSFTYW